MMKKKQGIRIANELFSKIIGLPVHSLYQASCSFINMYWGNKKIKRLETKCHGVLYIPTGDWWLSIYMCSWEIFKNEISIAYSESSREEIALALAQIEEKKLSSVKIQNRKFDMLLAFDLDNQETMHIQIWADPKKEEHEPWKLFTPDGKCFTAGPGTTYCYEPVTTN